MKEYSHFNKRLEDQFINGIFDKAVTNKLIKELTSKKTTSEAISKQGLMCAEVTNCHA